ncbi:MAG: chorismate lyase [Castellaniella sp.]
MPAQAPSYSQWSAQALLQASALQQEWLNRPGALTAGLRDIGHVDLRVVRECPSLLTADEAWMLAHPVNTPIWLREIVMAIDGEDAVFARSFTPLAASTGLWRGMRSLQTRPLADMLYHDREISRSGFFHSRLSPQQPMYRSARHALGAQCPPAGALLARCSVFRREQAPLLVAESFLPAFWDMAGGLP